MAYGEDGQGLGRESLCLWELATTHSKTVKQDYQGENRPVSSRYGYYSMMFLVKLVVLINSLLEKLPMFHSILISDSRSLFLVSFLYGSSDPLSET